MTKGNKFLLFILFALCGVGWIACTQERAPCLTPKIASLIIETIHLPAFADTSYIDTALPAAVFIPLTTTKNDTGVIYPQQSEFTISLSPDSNICRWAFTTDTPTVSFLFDTLTFYYQRQLQFLSNACGFTYFYSMDSVHTTKHNIDSFRITNTSVTNNVNTKHLQIFIHPDYIP